MSLVMTCYNTAPYAEAAILSCLNQVYAGPLQFVLVNDASTDDTLNVIKATVEAHGAGRDIEIVDLPQNMGVAGATDAGWARAKYEWIIMIDGDDIQCPERCQRTADLITRYPKARMITLSAQKFCADGDLDIQSYCTGDYETAPEEMYLSTPQELADNYLHRTGTHRMNSFGCAMAFHRSLYEIWGPLHNGTTSDAHFAQDPTWELRAMLSTPVLGSRKIACRYRLHDQNIFNRKLSTSTYKGIINAELFFGKMMNFRIGTFTHLLLDWKRAKSENLTHWSEADMDDLHAFLIRKLNGSYACGNWWQTNFREKLRRIRQYRRISDIRVLRWGAPRLLPLWLYAALARIGIFHR
jgi:glycosyltransferase involved in cell wall biosynthesis